MERNRLRDMALGFLLCAALATSYHCGRADSPMGPGAANASNLSSDRQVVGAFRGDYLGYVVVDTQTGKIVSSEYVRYTALGTHNGIGERLYLEDRYW